MNSKKSFIWNMHIVLPDDVWVYCMFFRQFFFWRKGKFLPKYKPAVLVGGALIGVQGLIGWLMVKSGLDHDPEGKHVPRVSHYRLCAHLGTAFTLYSTLLWTAMAHLNGATGTEKLSPMVHPKLLKLRGMSLATASLIFVTALSGALVAGLDAGLVYNSFPKMGDNWVPEDLMTLSPPVLNFLENPTTVQFDHRILGITTASTVAFIWKYSRPLPLPGRARLASNLLLGMVAAQVTLGISTLLYFVPTPLAATHQAGSVGLLSFALWFAHELQRLPRF